MVYLRNNILEDLKRVPEDTMPKQLNVTGMEQPIDSSFMTDQHLSETNQIFKPLQGTQTTIQQQLSRDV
jgi:hypothetical protein